MCEELGESAGLRELLVETGHAQVEHFLGLLASEPRRLAGRSMRLAPRIGEHIESAGDARELIRSAGLAGREKRTSDFLAAIRIPDAGELLFRAPTGERL